MLATFAHRDIVDQLDISSRTLAFWCDEGVLSPESRRPGAGTGVRRRFAASEVEIAAILSELLRMKLPIGTLREIAQFIRLMQAEPKRFQLHSSAGRSASEQRVLLRLAPTPAGWFGYAINARSGERKFDPCSNRDSSLDCSCFIEVNLTSAFTKLREFASDEAA